jgi:lipid-binding SYLF domain-containing protein
VSERLGNAAEVFGELLNAPDADVPEGLLEDADCVAVIPDVRRAALGFGGQSGRGAASCRTESGWSAPSMLALDGGSIGFQIGVSSSDVVLLFMADDSIRHLTGGEVTLGGDASVAAGPKGRDAGANTNLTFEAEILSYSRSRGVFAGISIEGASMRPDDDANEVLYGREVEAGEVLRGGMPVPEMAAAFIEALRSH